MRIHRERFVRMGALLTLVILLGISCGKRGVKREISSPGTSERAYLPTQSQAGASIEEVWVEIEALEKPANLPDDLFGELKEELGRALKARGIEKFPKRAPTQDIGNGIVLTTSSTGLSWNEARAGDWNNDGAVSAQDLSPLALYFGKKSEQADPNYYKYAEYIDGNGDGVVNAGDVTAIAFHFGESTDGYNIYEADDSSGAGALKVASTTRPPVPDDPGNPPANKSFATLQYDTSMGSVDPPGWFPTEGKFYQVIPFDTSTSPLESTDVKSEWVELLITTPENRPPVAVAQANPKSGRIPLNVSFNASGSYDPDGVITLYEWDFDDDGTYDFQSSTNGFAQHTYQDAGGYTAWLRVTDDKGGSAKVYVTIAAFPLENRPPIAVANAIPASGNAPLDVAFTAAGSYDPDGPLVLYEWDFEGDGYYDVSNSTGDTSYLYQSGIYDAKLRVTDEWGVSATATVRIVTVTGPGDWWMYGRDATHQARSPFEGPSTSDLKWTYPLWADAKGSPAIASDGTIYAIDYQGLHSLNPDGTLKWLYQVYDPSSPAIGADGTIYFGSGDGNLYAVDQNGIMKWRYLTGDSVYSPPAIAPDGTIYFCGADTFLYALEPDGTLKWRFQSGFRLNSSPAIGYDGTIYFGGSDWIVYKAEMYAVNPDGTLKWSYAAPIDHSGISDGTIGPDGTVYFVSYDGAGEGYLCALDSEGSLKRELWFDGNLGLVAIGPDSTVYVGCSDNFLYALTPSFTIKWTYRIEGQGTIGPGNLAIGSDGTVYFGVGGESLLEKAYGYVYAVDPSGNLKWRYKTDSAALGAISEDGTLYVESAGLYAFGVWKDNIPPVAKATAMPSLGLPPLTVTLSAAGSYDPDGAITKYEWDFTSDGVYDSLGQEVVTTYLTAGIYRARVKVEDNKKAKGFASAVIIVNAPPHAEANAEPDNGWPPLEVHFNANGSGDQDGNIVLYEWDYTDDGIYDYSNYIGSGLYTYNVPGDYTARLRVTDNYGATATATVSVNVYPP